jgi:hypothetical protein
MLSPEDEAVLAPRLMTMRIILGAMMMGVLSCLVIMVILRAQGGRPEPEQPMVSYVLLLLAVGATAASLFVPGLVAAGARRSLVGGRTSTSALASAEPPADTVGFWCGIYQTRLIIASALLEGPALALLIAYLLEGTVWTLATGALLLGLMALRFPTQSGVEQWIEEQRNLLERERMMG